MKEKRYLINLWRVLLIGVLAAFLPNTAKAWEGSGTTSYDPYLIKTIADMTQLANDVNSGNSYAGKYFALAENLEYTGTSNNYIPIGDNNIHSFSGHFDGCGKTIKGIRCTSDTYDYLGLFGCVLGGGYVMNVTLEDCQFISTKASSTHVATIGYCSYPDDDIFYIKVKNCVFSAKNGYVAGIVGYSYANVKSCVVENTTITVMDGTTLQGIAGGIVAHQETHNSSNNLVRDCTIKAGHAAGIIGHAGSTDNVDNNIVEDCTITGDVSAAGISSNSDKDKHPTKHNNNIVVGVTTIKVPDTNRAAALFAVNYQAEPVANWANNYYDNNGADRCVVIIGDDEYSGTAYERGALDGDYQPSNRTIGNGAVGKPFYKITTKTSPEGITTITAPRRYLDASESMDIRIDSVPKGYYFDGWTITGGGSLNDKTDQYPTYTAGTDNATLTAVFKAKTPASATITPATDLVYKGASQKLVKSSNLVGAASVRYSWIAPGEEGYDPSLTEDDVTGLDAGDYTIYYAIVADEKHSVVEGSVKATINPKPLTATVTAANKVYDGTTNATITSATVNTGIASERLTISGLTGTFDNANVGTGKTVTINSTNAVVTAQLSDTKVGNYKITYPNTTANITARGLNDNPNTGAGEGKITIELNPTEYTYDGTEKKPTVTVKDGDKVVPKEEYTVTYSNNINAGTATATIGNATAGNYIVSGTKNFVINKAQITTVKLDQTTLHFNSKAQQVKVTQVLAGTVEVPATDYTVSGDTQTKVGNYELTVTAKDGTNFTGSKKAQYSIIAEGASTFDVSIPADSYPYTGNEIKPVPVVKEGDVVLKEGVDYTVSYSDNVNVGTATITITGIGGYSGTKVLHFEITKTDDEPSGDEPSGDEPGGDDSGEGGGSTTLPTITVTATGFDGIYDGKAHGINVNVTSPTETTVLYGESANNCTQKTSPTYTAAGTKTVYYQVTKDGYQTAQGSAVVKIAPKPVTVSGITAEDKDYDGNTDATLHLEKVVIAGVVDGDKLAVSAKGEFNSATPGANKTVYIREMVLNGDKAANYTISEKSQKTTTATIHPNTKSGIRVIRNTDGTEVPNAVYLDPKNGGMKITLVDITPVAPVEVSVYIPATLKNFDVEGATSGVGSNCLNIPNGVVVTDIYLPNTGSMLSLDEDAFQLKQNGPTTARIHVSLELLDDYALCKGLKDEYKEGKVMTTVNTSTRLWTFSSGVNILVPDNLVAKTCWVRTGIMVSSAPISGTTAMVEGQTRNIVKHNNGVMMDGEPGAYDLVAWPSADRKTGDPISTENAYDYDGNELVPVIVATHFPPTEYYILYENQFHELESEDQTMVTPCHAVLPKGSAQSRTLDITNSDGTTRILGTSTYSEDEDMWFDVQGRKLAGKPNRSGLYIHNGKKEIIK